MTHIIALSGGMDSCATADLVADNFADTDHIVGVSFDYGQRHRKEIVHAENIANELGIHHHVVNIEGVLTGSALLGETDVPHGHYSAETMRKTVVQGRNLLFVSLLVAKAQPDDTVWLSVHAGDHPIYPDCRPEFTDRIGAAIYDAYGVSLATPWSRQNKATIIKTRPDAPYHLSWSCYEGGEQHCGRCGTCVERAEAFHLAGVTDPTTYADPDYWKQVT